MKLSKRIAVVVVCVVCTVCLTTSLFAEIPYTPVTGTFMTDINGATVTMSLYPTPTSCTATTSLNKSDVSTSSTVTVGGTYYENGELKSAYNAGYGTVASTATITCGKGTWMTVNSTHYGKYAGLGRTGTLSIP